MATTQRPADVPRDSLWFNKPWMGNDDQLTCTSSNSASTSTLVDETGHEMCLDEFDDNDFVNLPRIPTPRTSGCNAHDLYLSPFAETSMVYVDMPEIPLVPAWADHPQSPKNLTAHEQSFWSNLKRPQWGKPTKGDASYDKHSIPHRRCVPPPPPLAHSTSVSSTSSAQTKVTTLKSSLSSASSKDSRKTQPSVKFVETPIIHYNYSYHTYPADDVPLPAAPRVTKPTTDGGFAKLKRIAGSWRKLREQQQAVPARRPSISGPYPMYCAPALRDHGLNGGQHPARSCASLRSTTSASSGTSSRSFWNRFTRPDG